MVDFKWLKNVDNFDVNSVSENSSIGSILEVDLEFPDELHVKLEIPYDMLSDYSKKIEDEYRIKVGNVKKLVPNLGNKTKYIVYYKNLQLYSSLGIKLTKIQSAKI